MKFSEKLVLLRKEKNLSQEELAEVLDISRQSVSKWESGQSYPDYNKLIKLSDFFGVSTDYLLKDNYDREFIPENEECVGNSENESNKNTTFNYLSLSESQKFLEIKEKTSEMISIGIMFCIFSPIWIFLTIYVVQLNYLNISIALAEGIGISLLLFTVACGVTCFIYSSHLDKYCKPIKEEIFDLDEKTRDYIITEQEKFSSQHLKYLTIGIILCILSAVPIILVSTVDNTAFFNLALSVTLLIIGIGVLFIVKNTIIWNSFKQLLQIDDYTIEKKLIAPKVERFTTLFWLTIVIFYLAVSFIFDNWENSWIIFPIAGVTYAALKYVLETNLLNKNKE